MFDTLKNGMVGNLMMTPKILERNSKQISSRLTKSRNQMKKYLNILGKVQASQEKKDKFYSSLMNVEALVSPKLHLAKS